MSRLKTPLVGLTRLFLGLLAFLAFASISSPANASCIAQQEDGSWRNADPNTQSLTRADLRFTCQDQVVNGELFPPGPPWHVHLWGKCHPADCDWSEVGAQVVTSGSRTFVHTVYDQGFARVHVYADMSIYRPGQLWIWTWTDFTDPGRSDYGSHDWFVRR